LNEFVLSKEIAMNEERTVEGEEEESEQFGRRRLVVRVGATRKKGKKRKGEEEEKSVRTSHTNLMMIRGVLQESKSDGIEDRM
jgi:hypothetical protein